MKKEISLSEVVGKGYKDYWNSKKRYVAIKGGRGSKKSRTTAIWFIWNLMKHREANALIIRKTFNTLRDSCFSDLNWAINRLSVSHLWKARTNPLSLEYVPTGQKILFRGLDDPLKLTSITVEKGYLCWVWVEEAFELMNENDFNKLDLSIRGKMPENLWKQIRLTFNPWDSKHWLNARFFQKLDEDIDSFTTTYMTNEFLGEEDRKIFEKMKKTNPRRYEVEGAGNWGIAEGLIFENWEETEFDFNELLEDSDFVAKFGLDFGYTNDPTAFIAFLQNDKEKTIYIFDEHYQKKMLNIHIANMIKAKGYAKEQIIADSAEPKSIEEIRRLGISRIKPSVKGKDSVLNGIQKIQQYKIFVHPRCVNTITELSTYIWENKNDKTLNKPSDMNNHLMDAFRYAIYREKEKGIMLGRKIIGV